MLKYRKDLMSNVIGLETYFLSYYKVRNNIVCLQKLVKTCPTIVKIESSPVLWDMPVRDITAHWRLLIKTRSWQYPMTEILQLSTTVVLLDTTWNYNKEVWTHETKDHQKEEATSTKPAPKRTEIPLYIINSTCYERNKPNHIH